MKLGVNNPNISGNAASFVTTSAVPIVLGINNTEALRVSATGNLGIGTTSPSQLLSIQGNGLFSGNLSLAGLTATGTVTTNALTITGQAAAAGTNCVQIDTVGVVTKTGSACGGAGATPGGTSGAIQFNQAGAFAGNTGFTYDFANTRIGIGTSSPYAMLSLVATSTTNYVNGALFVVASSTNGAATTTLFTVLNTGNVGIGTTSPLRKLHVADNGSLRGQIMLEDTNATANNHYFSLQTVNGAFNLNSLTDVLATTTRFTIDPTGNIGVGTTSPLSKLSISGGVSIGADYNVAAPTNGLIVQGNLGIEIGRAHV